MIFFVTVTFQWVHIFLHLITSIIYILVILYKKIIIKDEKYIIINMYQFESIH